MESNKKSLIFHIFSLCLSYILSAMLMKFYNIQFRFKEIIFFTIMYAIFVIANRAFNIKDKRMIIGAALFSPMLSVSFVIGRKIRIFEEPYFQKFGYTDIVYGLLFSVFLYFVFVNIINFISKGNADIDLCYRKIGMHIWVYASLIIFICWLPYFLSGYPGNIHPDSISSINQSIGITPLYNHHPIMFTLFVKFFINLGLLLGDINFAIACFSVAQMFIMSTILGYFIYWIVQKGIPIYIGIFCFMYFALNPVIAIYSTAMLKDTMFGGWMLLLVISLYDIVESKGKLITANAYILKIVLLGIVISFARNNGYYVVVLSFVALIVCYRKYIKKAAPAILAILVIIPLVQGPGYSILGIGKGGIAESLGIPIQQISYAVKYDENLTKDQEEFINQMIPIDVIKTTYRPYSPDYIKFNKSFNNEFLEENKLNFFINWFSIMRRNFKGYLKAWLLQTIGYWHIGTTNWIYIFGMVDSAPGIYSTNILKKFMGIDITGFIELMSQELKGGIPIISNFQNIAFMVWLLFFYCMYIIVVKKYEYILSVMPLIGLWGTMMVAAPTFCEFRYMFSFYLLTPFILFSIFTKNRKCNPNIIYNNKSYNGK